MRKQKKKLRSGVWIGMAALVLFLSAAPPVSAQTELNSIAESAILMEASTGEILYEKNADNPLPPASITKLMTLLLGLEALENGNADWDDPVAVSEKAWRVEGSRMFLEVGTKVPLKEVITGISVVSANDGCIALAEHLCGTEEEFVRQMNKRAEELGLTQTRFQDCNGLPVEGHHMSARDIAILARYLIANHPKILEFSSITEFTYNGIYQKNPNPLLGNYPGADGLKTGRTNEAGYCLAGTAVQNGMRLISVVLKTKDEEERLAASRELLDYGYGSFELWEAPGGDKIVGEVPVRNGKERTVPVRIAETMTAVIPKGRKEDMKISVVPEKEPVSAPVAAGAAVGSAEVRLDGKVLATAGITTVKKVEKANFFAILFRNIGDFFKSLFKISKG